MNNHRILVVDDEPELVNLVKIRLERAGYQVSTAAGGREGLRAAQEAKPHLILLDVTMPDLDGFSMLRQLKADQGTCDIPVVMVTARSDMSSLRESEKGGAVDYFIKPFDWDHLLKYIQKYINLSV